LASFLRKFGRQSGYFWQGFWYLSRAIQDFRHSGLRGFRASEFSNSRILEIRTLGLQELRDSGIQELRTSGIQEFRDSGIQGLRDSGIHEFRGSGIQGLIQKCRHSGIRDFRNTGIQEFLEALILRNSGIQYFWHSGLHVEVRRSHAAGVFNTFVRPSLALHHRGSHGVVGPPLATKTSSTGRVTFPLSCL